MLSGNTFMNGSEEQRWCDLPLIFPCAGTCPSQSTVRTPSPTRTHTAPPPFPSIKSVQEDLFSSHNRTLCPEHRDQTLQIKTQCRAAHAQTQRFCIQLYCPHEVDKCTFLTFKDNNKHSDPHERPLVCHILPRPLCTVYNGKVEFCLSDQRCLFTSLHC